VPLARPVTMMSSCDRDRAPGVGWQAGG
jgi:hypothetical protein